MSKNVKSNQKQNEMFSIWKERKKPFLFVEVFIALTATVLSVINLVRWNTDLSLISFLITMLVGIVFIIRGIESRLNKEKGYKITISLGTFICIISIITFIVKYL